MDLAGVAQAIRDMRIRGATEIALRAADALAKHVSDEADPVAALRQGAELLEATRPTAVSLHNAVAAVRAAVEADPGHAAQAARQAAHDLRERVGAERVAVASLLRPVLEAGPRVLTHCHATQVIDVLVANRDVPGLHVWATETRPFGQGRITVAALRAAGIPATLLVDGAVSWRLAQGDIDQVLVGADTVLRDGSLVNKIGTRNVALAAHHEGVPLRSVAGFMKFSDADTVAIEERPAAEVTGPEPLADGATVWNPVFDVTPAPLILHYCTADGLRAPAENPS